MKRVVNKVRHEPFPIGLEKRSPAGAGAGCALNGKNRVLIQENGMWGNLFHPTQK